MFRNPQQSAMAKPPTLESTPEPSEALAARYPAAIEKLWEYDRYGNCACGLRPSTEREHVFDFEDGLRMIISRDHHVDEPEPSFIHVSASFGVGTELFKILSKGLTVDIMMADFKNRCSERFSELSGELIPETATFIMSDMGVFHWKIWQDKCTS
jgi:hypothetical protein